MPQLPDTHAATELAGAQTAPQPPQLAVLEKMFTSQPFDVAASQLAYPTLHVEMPQVPALQIGVAFAGAQVFPQPPQCAVLLSVFTSQPFQASPSQFA